ncbi:MAG: hypothetical protein WKF57_03885 [Nakamurella sp.]
MSIQHRVVRGTPTGGQFRGTRRPDAGIFLGDDSISAESSSCIGMCLSPRDIGLPNSTGVPEGSSPIAIGHPDCEAHGHLAVTRRCHHCGRFAPRVGAHRCEAPNLIVPTESAQAVLAACARAGGRPLIVGGSVRDALLAAESGNPCTPKDIDIEVYGADVDALIAELGHVGRVDEVGRSFGVLKVTVFSKDGSGAEQVEDFDVSLPRADSKTGTGHRGFEVRVDHDLDEVEAFGRRDFTVNAIGWDPATHELVDPYGGSRDLADRVLRHTTDAFAEDPLWVLRGVQFAGRFEMSFAPDTAQLCRELSGSFAELPKERVWGEFAKIALMARRPSMSLDALHEIDWERHFPELAALRGVPQDPQWHPEGAVHVHLGMSADAAADSATAAGLDGAGLNAEDRMVVVLGAMVHDFGKATHTDLGDRITSHGHAEAGVEPAISFLRSIGAPERLVTKIGPVVREHMAVASAGDGDPSPAAVRRMIRRLSEPNGQGPGLKVWAAVVAADHAGRGTGSGPSPADAWLRVAEQLGEEPEKPKPGLLTGRHLIAAGMKPGPQFKEILAAALSAQDDGEFEDANGALAWFRHHQRAATG